MVSIFWRFDMKKRSLVSQSLVFIGLVTAGWILGGELTGTSAYGMTNLDGAAEGFAAPVDPVPSHVVMPEDVVTTPSVVVPQDQDPLFIALFGDSVSLGTMADATLGNPGPRYYADFIGSLTAGTVYDYIAKQINRQPTEDEQHELIQKLFGNMARKYLSPYLGSQDYSLPVLIEEKTGLTPKVYNGAQMAGSYNFSHIYLDKFARFYKRNPFHKKPELVVVNFNGMDFMESRSPEVYQAKVKNFYRRLTAMVPQAKIVVSGIKDPVALLTHPDRVAIPYSPIGPVTCSTVYKVVRFANSTGLFPGASQEAIDAARARLEVLRGILETEVQLINEDRQQYPSFKGEAIYVDPSIDDGITADMIAADCIHPNKEAQKIIGDKMWEVIEPLL